MAQIAIPSLLPLPASDNYSSDILKLGFFSLQHGEPGEVIVYMIHDVCGIYTGTCSTFERTRYPNIWKNFRYSVPQIWNIKNRTSARTENKSDIESTRK